MPDDSPLSLEMKVDPFDPHSRFERSVVKRLDVFPESGLAYCRCPRCVTFSSDLLQTDQRHSATRDEGQRLPVRCGVRPQSRRLSPGGQPRSSLRCSAHHLHRPSRCWPARGNQEQGVKTQCQLCKDSVQVNPPSLYRKPQFFFYQIFALQQVGSRVVKSVSHWKPQLSITVMSEDFTFNKAGLPNDVRRFMRV